jgi:hypothetical protein
VALNNQMTSSRAATRKVLMSESEEDRLIEQNLPEGEEDVSWRVVRERRQFTGVLQLGPEISEEALPSRRRRRGGRERGSILEAIVSIFSVRQFDPPVAILVCFITRHD